MLAHYICKVFDVKLFLFYFYLYLSFLFTMIENSLSPIYHQISVTFADLHDTPGRMLSKNVIKEVIEWKTSRTFFYWRLRRLIAQDNVVKKILAKTRDRFTFEQALDLLKNWFAEASLANSSQLLFKKNNKFEEKSWNNNEFVTLWLENEVGSNSLFENDSTFIQDKLRKLKHDNILNQLKEIIEHHPTIAIESISYLIQSTSADKIKEVIAILNEKVASINETTPQASDSSLDSDNHKSVSSTAQSSGNKKGKETAAKVNAGSKNSPASNTNTNKK